MATCIPSSPFQKYIGTEASAILQTPVFSLQGAATGNISSVSGITKNNFNNTPIQFATENILFGAEYISNTTLLSAGKSYTLAFIAIHRPVWSSVHLSQQILLQLSMVFKRNKEIFHIGIPIFITPEPTTNSFLNWWMNVNPTGAKPSTFSANDLLLFGGQNTTASFDFYNHCVKYDSITDPVQNYFYCDFITPINLSMSQIPPWLLGMYQNPQVPPRLSTFNEIFNCMFQGTDLFDASNNVNLVSTRQLFVDNPILSGVKPSKYSVNVSVLAFKNPTTQKERQLKNIKCYPIDLASQVDDNGNIFIDEITKKPMDIDNLKSTPEKSDITPDQTGFQNKILYWVIFSVISCIALACIIALVLWVFTTKDTVPVDFASAPSAPAPAPAPSAPASAPASAPSAPSAAPAAPSAPSAAPASPTSPAPVLAVAAPVLAVASAPSPGTKRGLNARLNAGTKVNSGRVPLLSHKGEINTSTISDEGQS
jgi:hypothetical protein